MFEDWKDIALWSSVLCVNSLSGLFAAAVAKGMNCTDKQTLIVSVIATAVAGAHAFSLRK